VFEWDKINIKNIYLGKLLKKKCYLSRKLSLEKGVIDGINWRQNCLFIIVDLKMVYRASNRNPILNNEVENNGNKITNPLIIMQKGLQV